MDLSSLTAAIRDPTRSIEDRTACIQQLEGSSEPERFGVVLKLATDQSLLSEVAREVGRAAARIAVAADRLVDLPLSDFSGPAYLGYDEQVAASS